MLRSTLLRVVVLATLLAVTAFAASVQAQPPGYWRGGVYYGPGPHRGYYPPPPPRHYYYPPPPPVYVAPPPPPPPPMYVAPPPPPGINVIIPFSFR